MKRNFFFKTWETWAQKYRDALRMINIFCFFQTWQQRSEFIKFCSIFGINTHSMIVHLRDEILNSACVTVRTGCSLNVSTTFQATILSLKHWGLECRRREGTDILLSCFFSYVVQTWKYFRGWQHMDLNAVSCQHRLDLSLRKLSFCPFKWPTFSAVKVSLTVTLKNYTANTPWNCCWCEKKHFMWKSIIVCQYTCQIMFVISVLLE